MNLMLFIKKPLSFTSSMLSWTLVFTKYLVLETISRIYGVWMQALADGKDLVKRVWWTRFSLPGSCLSIPKGKERILEHPACVFYKHRMCVVCVYCVCECMYVCMCVCVCMHVCTCVYSVCVCNHINYHDTDNLPYEHAPADGMY